MIFVDTNVFMHAVGREHPLRDEARAVFRDAMASGETLAQPVGPSRTSMISRLAAWVRA